MSETLTVTLPSNLVVALCDAVRGGEYSDVDAALIDAIEVWATRHEDREETAAWIRARIKASLADPRPALTGEEVDAHLEAFFANVERQANEAA